MYIDIFIYISIDEGINCIILNDFKVKLSSYNNKNIERMANEGRSVRFLPYFLYLLISTNNKMGFNFIELTILKGFVRIYLYIVEDLFISNI